MITTIKRETATPQRLKMSYEEYLEFADDSRTMEWVEGEVIIYMPPVDRHQEVSLFLSALLNPFIQFFQLGVLRYAPLEVKLWPDGPSREPDLFFVSSANRAKLTEEKFEGGPDLIVEVISPGSVTEDRVRKFEEYERAGVREYWIIDPRPYQQQADFYTLDENGRYQPAPVDDEGVYYAAVLPDFWLKPAWLQQEKLPNPQFVVAEIMLSLEKLPTEAKAAYQAMYALWAKRA